jgi:hypothetical protein
MKTANRLKRRVDHVNRNTARTDAILRELYVAEVPGLAEEVAREERKRKFDQLDAELDERFPHSRNMYYKLNPDHSVEPCGLFDWSEAFEKIENRRIAFDELEGVGFVSTIFLGMDHSFFEGPPLLFETMARIGDRWAEEVMRRYSTYDEALAGHNELLAEHRAAVAAVNSLKPKNEK